MRIRLDVSYDGTDFKGWATQPDLRTVQGVLEEALALALRLPQVRVVCAGRTDTGVHARGQVVHLDVESDDLARSAGRAPGSPFDALTRRVNGILPPDVRVRRATLAPPGFDARFSAIWRRYAYRIADRPDLVDPLSRRQVLAWRHALDLEAMNAAAVSLIGLQDFATFCKRREGATTIRTLLEFEWQRSSDGLLEGRVVADAFCHSMVRSLVGCMLAVGEGRQPPQWAAQMLAGRARDASIVVVPALGLTLEEVGYPEGEELVAQAARARAKRTQG